MGKKDQKNKNKGQTPQQQIAAQKKAEAAKKKAEEDLLLGKENNGGVVQIGNVKLKPISLSENQPESSASRDKDGNLHIAEIKIGANNLPKISISNGSIDIGGFKLEADALKRAMDNAPTGTEDDLRDPEFRAELQEYAASEAKQIMDSSLKRFEGHEQKRAAVEASSSSPSAGPAPPPLPASPPPLPYEAPPTPPATSPPRTVECQKVIVLTRPQATANRSTVVNHEDMIQQQMELMASTRMEKRTNAPRVPALNKSALKKIGKNQLVSPNGTKTPYYEGKDELVPDDPTEAMKKLWKGKKRLDEDPLHGQHPDVIAAEIMKPDFKLAFHFKVTMHFAFTGLARTVDWVYTGDDTWDRFKRYVKKKWAEQNNFQMFFRDFHGRYIEVMDSYTLRMMCVTHGAYPRGARCYRQQATAMAFWTATASFAQNEIFEYTVDSVQGIGGDMSIDTTFYRRLPAMITPSSIYKDIALKITRLRPEDEENPYNQFTNIVQLNIYCTRDAGVEERFAEPRSKDLSTNELKAMMEYRWMNPYLDMTPDDSLMHEIMVIVNQLKKSRFQKREALEQAEKDMKDMSKKTKERMKYERNMAETQARIAAEEEARKNFEIVTLSTNQLEARLRSTGEIPGGPGPQKVPPPMRMDEFAKSGGHTHGVQCRAGSGFKEVTVETRPNPGYVPHYRETKVLEDPTGKGFTPAEVMQKTREFVAEQPTHEHWTSKEVSKAGPSEPETPEVPFDQKLDDINNLLADCDGYTPIDKILTVEEMKNRKPGDNLEMIRKEHWARNQEAQLRKFEEDADVDRSLTRLEQMDEEEGTPKARRSPDDTPTGGSPLRVRGLDIRPESREMQTLGVYGSADDQSAKSREPSPQVEEMETELNTPKESPRKERRNSKGYLLDDEGEPLPHGWDPRIPFPKVIDCSKQNQSALFILPTKQPETIVGGARTFQPTIVHIGDPRTAGYIPLSEAVASGFKPLSSAGSPAGSPKKGQASPKSGSKSGTPNGTPKKAVTPKSESPKPKGESSKPATPNGSPKKVVTPKPEAQSSKPATPNGSPKKAVQASEAEKSTPGSPAKEKTM